jgi:hypothetical protein
MQLENMKAYAVRRPGTILFLLVAFTSLLMHLPHFPKELMSAHVWRQTQTQSTINSFYEEDFNILNPKRNERGSGDGVFRMEFPLMQWLIAGVYKIFGSHIAFTRIFMFITGLFAVWGMYQIVLRIFKSTWAAVIAAWAFNFSPCFYYYTINPLPDVFALACGLCGIAFFLRWHDDRQERFLWLSGLLLSVATLCKLPFILFYTLPAGYFLHLLIKEKFRAKTIYEGLRVASFIVLPLAWYISVIPGWKGNGIVQGMMDNQADWGQLAGYLEHNLISTLPELLLNYAAVPFFLAGFYFLLKRKAYTGFWFPFLLLWSAAVAAYFFFEINMIAKVHDYYLFPFYPLLFIIVAYGAKEFFRIPGLKRIGWVLLLLMPFTAYIRNMVRWNPAAPGFNPDLLTYKEELRSAVPADALCIVGNDESHFIFFYYVDKKGWGFDKDILDPDRLQQMMAEGAEYIYSDSREVEKHAEISPYLGSLLGQYGSISLYRLVSPASSD